MGFLSDVGKALGGGSGGGGGGLLTAAGTIIGGLINSDANDDAAKKAKRIAQNSGRMLEGGLDEQAAALLGANDEIDRLIRSRYLDAQGNVIDPYGQYAEAGTPALQYLMNEVARDPGTMNPEQQRDFEANHRDSLANLARSSLRGAGRAGVAAVNEGDAAYRSRAFAENQQRKDRIASELMRGGVDATTNGQIVRDRYTAAAGDVAANRGAITGGTALQKAEAKAGAYTTGESAIANANQANQIGWGNSLGYLLSVLPKALTNTGAAPSF